MLKIAARAGPRSACVPRSRDGQSRSPPRAEAAPPPVTGYGDLFGPVHRVAQHRVAQRGHVYADLMRAPGLQPRPRCTKAPRSSSSTRQCVTARRPPSRMAHLLAVGGVAADGRVHHAHVFPKMADADGQIGALHRVFPDLLRQRHVGAVVLGHQQEPGGVLVNAVYQPGPLLAADAGKAVQVVEQGVDQRAVRLPGPPDGRPCPRA